MKRRAAFPCPRAREGWDKGKDHREWPFRDSGRLIGLVISESTILKYLLQLHWALERWQQSAIEALLTLPAMHVDETSLRVARKNHWIHVCSAGEITLKFLHPKRRQEAIKDIGVIPATAV